jgi:hypothetical protein
MPDRIAKLLTLLSRRRAARRNAPEFARSHLAVVACRSCSDADVWGTAASRLPSELCELDEAARIDVLESVLLARLAVGRQRAGALDVEGAGGERRPAAGPSDR